MCGYVKGEVNCWLGRRFELSKLVVNWRSWLYFVAGFVIRLVVSVGRV